MSVMKSGFITVQAAPSYIFDSPSSDINSCVFNETPNSFTENHKNITDLQNEVRLRRVIEEHVKPTEASKSFKRDVTCSF